ncbi:transcriptional activator domain-containing protein [Asanoa hainanensis]|uniref:Transcriptional activator domain-containing protein n=1 Tax=Asanoa hainanensis TaxID=560556 RepID=A0A239NZ01_9ACTN|nr:AAA family ATPase [Asanoa hainanensis]SNT59604.1 transcriptional activator domain-containing protein [Asanoa hainanensis]
MGTTGIRLIGPFAVVRGGRALSDAQVGSRKARTLLALLAAERRIVTVDRIVAVLWPGRPPQRPADNVATLVSRVRAALGQDLVEGGRGGYRLADQVTVDLHDAARLVADAVHRLASDPAAALDAAARAEEILAAAPALTGEPAADWAAAVRGDQAGHLRRARQTVAAAALAAGQPARARDAADAALRTDTFDEDAARALIRAHDALGEPARALAVYERLRAVLADELGVDPSPATRDVHVAVLRGTSVSPERPARGRLAGRERETAALLTAWQDAIGGRPGVVLLTGEPGIGKTRLAAELARLARGTPGTVVTVRCYAAERSLFLQPVVEAIGELVTATPPDGVRAAAAGRTGALAALVPAAAAVLGAPPAERGSPEAERRAAYDAVTTFLRRLSQPRPVLLVVDDLQHAGAATVELLHYLARHAGTARLLVVATVRAAEGRQAVATLDGVATTVPLGPLDEAAIAALARAAGQQAHVAEIARRTRGHTLFVVETLRALAAGDTGVPESLRASVLTRVRAAGAGAEELLRAAAVLGPSFAPATVAGLLGVGAAEATLRCERLLETRLTRVAGRAYEFANDLVQEVVYDSTPPPTRLAHHLRAADLLADNPEAVARHAQAAGDDRRAGRAWLAAGQRAARRYAAADAEALFDNAIDAAGRCADLELRTSALLLRARVRDTMFRYDDALADAAVALRLSRETGDRRAEMAALRELGGPAWAGVGRPVEDGIGHMRAALALAEQLGDRGAEAELLGWLAVLSSNQLRFVEALAYGRRAREVAPGGPALAAAYDGLKTAYAYLGEVAELSALLAELEPLVHGDLRLLQWCRFESAFPHLAAGRWAAAADRVSEAMAINERSGYRSYGPWFLAHLGWIARLDGRRADALELGRRASTMESHAWFSAAVDALHGTTLVEYGDPGAAIPVLERGLAVTASHRTAAYRLRCLAPLAEATGDPALLDEADALLRSVVAPPDAAWLYGADAYTSVARAWLARDEPERAAAVLDPLLAAGARTGWLAPLGAARVAAAAAHARLQNSSASRAAARSAPSVSTGR